MNMPESLFTAEKIKQRIEELGNIITTDYRGKEVVMIATLRGAFMFYADLIRSIQIPLSCEFLSLSHYGQQRPKSGELKVTLDLADPVVGKHVIIVEDLVDSGISTNFLIKYIKARNPASIKTCCLLMKRETLVQPIEVDYCGFKIDDEFVVGFGIDCEGKYRWLPYLAKLPKGSEY